MGEESTNELRDDQLRQHIGPAVKELREREGWSLRDLGARCGVSSAYLSRIERGSSVPSFSILASISSAFRVSPEYFIEFERSAKELETALAETLEKLNVPRSTWHEFAGLSMEAQGALVDACKQMTIPTSETDESHLAAEAMVLREGIQNSLEHLKRTAAVSGLSPVDFARHRTQLEETSADRFVIINRLCTLPASWLFDQLEVFRGTFGVEPADPMLLKWWVRSQRSALLKVLEGGVSRAVYSRENIRKYLRTGRWGKHVQFEPDLVREHVHETVKLLRESPTFQIGLVDYELPLRLLGKKGTGVLFLTPDDPIDRPDGAEGMALRFSNPQVTDLFQQYFDDIWDAIPEDGRANELVASWMESELAAGFATR